MPSGWIWRSHSACARSVLHEAPQLEADHSPGPRRLEILVDRLLQDPADLVAALAFGTEELLGERDRRFGIGRIHACLADPYEPAVVA
jgi:hypothetical protein